MNAPSALMRSADAPAPRKIRHFVPPRTLLGRLRCRRYEIARRALQLAVLIAFIGTAHWGWTAFGRPLLAGNLSAASVAGALPLADPFAVLQMLAARHALATEVLVGAALVLVVYVLAGGRAFCAWVCPMNLVTDTAHALRTRLGFGADPIRIPASTRYGVLALALVLSLATGVAAFEWVSPISMLHRELIFGAGLGLTAALGIFVLDAFVLKHGWCGHLCPLGAFYALVGRAGQIKVAFDAATCTRCGDCVKVCPEPRVLNFNDAARNAMVASGECTNCARCIAVCPESSLAFDLRLRIRATPTET